MRILVTGGGGFLGLAVVRELLARGHAPCSASRDSHAALDALGVESVRVDLGAEDAGATLRELRPFDAVIHTAAKAGVWGPAEEYERANVVGTRNLLQACLERGVTRLVHTSSPSVCFDGKDHLRAGNDLPYGERFLAAYPRTKAAAEKLVLKANGRSGLATCALRPHLLIGPGDPHLVPRLLERARARRLAIVGRGDNEVSLTYVDNAAAAHVDALEALDSPAARHAGRPYFLGQREPVRLWDWIDELLAALDLPRARRRIPYPVAFAAGGACELLWNALRLSGEPPMTRFVAAQLAASHSYDVGPAERDFGYRERVPLAEGTARVVEAFRSL